MKVYQERSWLNRRGHPSSGSVMAYHGPSPWDKKETMSVLEIADCHGKVRLHRAKNDSKHDFIRKMRKLSKVVARFADELDNE